jgi:hypothetical protein
MQHSYGFEKIRQLLHLASGGSLWHTLRLTGISLAVLFLKYPHKSFCRQKELCYYSTFLSFFFVKKCEETLTFI